MDVKLARDRNGGGRVILAGTEQRQATDQRGAGTRGSHHLRYRPASTHAGMVE